MIILQNMKVLQIKMNLKASKIKIQILFSKGKVKKKKQIIRFWRNK